MNYHLHCAERAITYARQTCGIKAQNLPENKASRPSVEELNASRAKARDLFGGSAGLTEVQARAEAAIATKAGNCTAQSAVAFEYLRKKGIHGLAWIMFPKHNHAFLMIGMPQRPADGNLLIGQAPPHVWGDAVVCDPWYNEWFVARTDWGRKIKYILGATTNTSHIDTETFDVIKVLPDNTQYEMTCRAYY